MYQPLTSQPNQKELEEATLARWQSEDTFAKSLKQNEGNQSYVIYDGPPYANAKPPLHTATPMTFKDTMGRFQTMRGKYVRRQSGWDTHGLPIEVQVEKKLGLASKKDILTLVPGDERASVIKFNAICKESVLAFKSDWDKFVPRVGYWSDLENPYITLTPDYVSKSWGYFKQVWDRGLAYQGYKVLPYCPRCGTGLSAAEVAQEYKDIRDISVTAAFPLVDNPSRSILAWTTTPWTLPGNVGLAVHPTLTYVAVQQEEGEFIVVKSRLSVLKGDYTILEEMPGTALVGMEYTPPFDNVFGDAPGKKHQVVAADFVTDTDGTGVVHTAVMYGEDDFNLGLAEGLVQMHSVGLDGCFLDNVPQFAGQNIREAIPQILTYLKGRNALYSKESHLHSYPHCWRCKTPLIYYAKDSWYIAMSKLRPELIAANETINWVPTHIRDGRFGDFVAEARDWAISRERFWGIPLPIWTAEDGSQICIGSLEELRSLAEDPSKIGEDFDPHRPFIDEIMLVKDGKKFVREPYVLDIWFDSGAMPVASGREERGEYPADFIAEAVDQTRGWFYSMLALAVATGKPAPYKRVVCMGHLVDETGKKMSKSVGNVADPDQIFAEYGADAFRWFILTVNAPGESKALSPKELQAAYRRSLMLLWNMASYFSTYANLAEFDPKQEVAKAEYTALDQWALSRQRLIVAEMTELMEVADFQRAGRLLEEHIGELSTWYLRRSRKRSDTAFFATMRQLLRTTLQLIAPFTPFMADFLWKTLQEEGDASSVHLTPWPVVTEEADLELLSQMHRLRQTVERGLALRSSLGQKVRQPLASVYVTNLEGASEELLTILAEELNVFEVKQVAELPENWPSSDGVAFDTVLTDELLEAGLARELQRQLQQLRKNSGLQPGEWAVLTVAPEAKFIVEPLIVHYPKVLAETFVKEVQYKEALEEIVVGEHTVAVALTPAE